MVVEGLKWHTEQIRWVDMVTFDKNARKIKVENRKNLAGLCKYLCVRIVYGFKAIFPP